MSHPLLYEINTRCWLPKLSPHGPRITLDQVPDSEFLTWQRLGFTHIWLMGVWSGGRRARAQALASTDLRNAYSQALGRWTEQDVGPSPYAIADYRVAADLGGNGALAKFRHKLASYGLKLLLDFVPNHVGLDHSWVSERPDMFVQAATLQPETFAAETVLGKRYLAHGKDPYWPAWTDTVQVDYRSERTRGGMITLLQQLANQCDGVRCDMAMLPLNDVFANTWKRFPTSEPAPTAEFWTEAIAAVRRAHPGFIFLSEVYWGLEARLQELGFDYTYDKVLYDQLLARQAASVQRHLLELPPHELQHGAHFLENHDEPRVASKLSLPEHRAAALVILALPGMRFLYEGQLTGMCKKLPVQLIRCPDEPEDAEIKQMYEQLLTALPHSLVGSGEPELLRPRAAWADNPTAQHFVLVQWSAADTFDLVAVNLAPHPSQCYAPVKPSRGSVGSWRMSDLLGTQEFVRNHEELRQKGLYLDLPAHGAQILHFIPHSGSAR